MSVFGNRKGFVVLHLNIRSLRANFDSFLVELSSFYNVPKVIVLSEIWISESEKPLYSIPNYNLYLQTNENYKSGGIAVYIANSVIDAVEIPVKFHSADVIDLSFNENGTAFNVIAIYRLHNHTPVLFIDELKCYLR